MRRQPSPDRYHELLNDASDVARAIYWINRISAVIKEVT
jgi:hypothetical protein